MQKELSLLDFAVAILRHRKLFLINFIFISVIAVLIAQYLPKSYKSEVVFIPKGPGGGNGIFALIGSSIGGDVIGGMELSKRQYVVLLESRELREQFIKKFDLINYYKLKKMPNPTDFALKILLKNIKISVSEEGGLGITDVIKVTITAIDKNPKIASEMANYFYYLLEQKIISLNQSEYVPLKHFLERQINDCDKKLITARENLRTFQKENKAYNVPAQVELTMQAIALNKAELLSIDNELSYQRSLHPEGFSGISILNQRRSMLERKLKDMELSQKTDLLPGLDQSIDLAYSYADFYKEVETYTQLGIILRQQYEQAKIRESKNFAPLYLVDSARPAEYKFKPKRAVVILVLVGFYMFFLVVGVFLHDYYRKIHMTNPGFFKRFSELINEK